MTGGPQGLVFRDSAAWTSQDQLAMALAAEVAAVAGGPAGAGREAALRALLSAGAFESALADGGGDPLLGDAMALTERLAWVALGRGGGEGALAGIAERVRRWGQPRAMRVSVPEGFAYYGLDPVQFATEAAAFVDGGAREPVVVVGIRTIGATLSAVVAAAVAGEGRTAERFTVRPAGHPYDRVLRASPEERARIERGRDAGATFLIVDEGPGLSGSSFLAAAECLVACGVPPHRVAPFGTRAVDPEGLPEGLAAPDGARRWRRFRSGALDGAAARWRAPDERDLSGGAWRALFWPASDDPRAPAVWPAMERLKALSPDGRALRKFEGLGGHGFAGHERAVELAAEGFSAAPLAPPDAGGFVAYPVVDGRPLARTDLTPAILEHLGRYTGARARLFAVADAGREPHEAFARMVETNVALALGHPPDQLPPPLPSPATVITDGRMMPHEWIAARPGGGLVKMDAVSHGDDHFFPGPTDIAWDLGGAIVEWELDAPGRELLLASHRRASGDDAGARVGYFVLAYAAFRARFAAMAAHASPPGEARRWRREQARYEHAVTAALPG